MPDPIDDKRLGEHLVSTGKLSSEALLSCFEEQRRRGGPAVKPLSEVIVEQGHISPLVLEETLSPVPQPAVSSGSETLRQSTTMDASGPPSSDSPSSAPDGPRVGRYIVLSELGQGGMGVVYRGYDPQLCREVAIKMIIAERGSDSQALKRFIREARACAKLRHPSIVAVHEAGEHDGNYYLVMDLVKGQMLKDVLDHGELPTRDLIRVVHEVCGALSHAHGAGIIHRDVTPRNVMLDEEGRALLMDFGLARDISAQQQLTNTGQMLGTPLYMAPEQIRGTGTGPWTDVYALGVMLYLVLTGEPPFSAENPMSLFRSILMEEPVPLRDHDPEIAIDLETITLKCLEKVPDRRYGDAGELEADLSRFLSAQAILARPRGAAEKTFRWAARNAGILVAIVVVALVVMGTTALGMAIYSQREAEKLTAKLALAMGAAQRELEARVTAENAAISRGDAESEVISRERERAKVAASQERHAEVMQVLDRVRTGKILREHARPRQERSKLLKYQHPETVVLLVAELDLLRIQLQEDHKLERGQQRFLEFLCKALADLGLQEEAVPALGRYLGAEVKLPAESRDQLRAVGVAKALSLLGGEEAEAYLEAARDGFGSNGVFWRQVAPMYRRLGGDPELTVDSPAGYSRRGFARMDKNDFAGAITDFSRVIVSTPNDAMVWAQRGLARQELEDLAGAEIDYSQALRLDASMHGVWINRANVRRSQGDLQGAMDDLTHAVNLEPSIATCWTNLGYVRYLAGDLNGAISDLTRALELDPNDTKAWFNRANARQAKGDFAGAAADFTELIKVDPHGLDGRAGRGKARLLLGDLDGAITDLTQGLDLNPDNASTWLSRGHARQFNGDLDGAIADYSRSIELDPDVLETWFQCGNARLAKGDAAGALIDYSRAIEVDPSHVAAWVNRGNARKIGGDLDGAIEDYTRAGELDPGLASVWMNRAIAYHDKGHLDRAIADYTRALECDPNDAIGWGSRGTARLEKGDIEGTIADWQRFVQLSPNHAKASAIRAEIQRLRKGQEKAAAGAGR